MTLRAITVVRAQPGGVCQRLATAGLQWWPTRNINGRAWNLKSAIICTFPLRVVIASRDAAKPTAMDRQSYGDLDLKGKVAASAHQDKANEIMKGNADALGESGAASRAAIQELFTAYQELTTKNARNMTAAMQALAAAKGPTEFIELQQRLIKEGVETAVGDSQRIAQLTSAVFTAPFEPVKKRIEAVQNAAHP